MEKIIEFNNQKFLLVQEKSFSEKTEEQMKKLAEWYQHFFDCNATLRAPNNTFLFCQLIPVVEFEDIKMPS